MVASSQSLNEFVNFRLQHITGREKSEAQTFLDRFFKAFGHQGALQAGAKYEVPIRMASRKRKTGYVDLAWKSDLLIEMKSQGEDLQKHYHQIYDYWAYFLPKRPKYCILSNFDEFWIYDFEIQSQDPVDKIPLSKLPESASAFGFMEVEEKTPIFANNQIEITQKTARKMGELCELLKERGKRQGFDTLDAQRLVLQCVLAMFAEDRGLLPSHIFTNCIQDCLQGQSSYDVLGGLFQEMNRSGVTDAGRYKGVKYFNGGLYAKIHPIELTREELTYLEEAAKENWQQVRPAIFGNIFEGTGNQKERHTYGMHFTSEADIMKIVKPTIIDYWLEKIDDANTIAELDSLKLELLNYQVLDPACGSGNFLYLAYQELKEIEKKLLDKISDSRRSEAKKAQGEISFVTPAQFYGIDINPFAVELAKVTLTIAKKVAIDRLQLTEKDLPLDTLDNNIVCADALFTDWIKADAIIGNPPFLGGKKLRQELGDDYAEKLYQQFKGVKGQPDLCSYWFRKTADNLDINGRAGLVGSNSIAQNVSRQASLDYVVEKSGYIHNAISTQTWSGEAKVHVSIVNWSNQKPQRLFLDNLLVQAINSSLKSHTDISLAGKIKSNFNSCFKGVAPNGKGFLVTKEEATKWIAIDSLNQKVIKLFSTGSNLAKYPHGKPDRWIIDFNDMSLEDASDYKLPFARVKTTIPIERQNNRNNKLQEYWWQYEGNRKEMRTAIEPLEYYFTVPRVSKWAVFIPAEKNWLPGDLSVVVASDDFYILGILTSNVHRLWIEAQSSSLGTTTRYTHTTCFETFPFPQSVDTKIIQKIRDKTLELHQYRTEQMLKKQWGITQLYNAYFHETASKLHQLHQQLDKLVIAAYNLKSDDDILSKLLELNLELTAKEKNGEKVIGVEAPCEN
jgi:methylase of polypeptide subunit release factors